MIGNTPEHVAIVMDGNGRWAKKRGLSHMEGHINGVDAVRRSIAFAIKRNIKTLSLFAFSTENMNRSKEEVSNIFSIYLQVLETDMGSLINQGVRVQFIGNFIDLPESVREGLAKLEKATKDNETIHLIVAMNYSGKWDIINAINKMLLNKAEFIDMDNFEKYLSTYPAKDPDLMIRTSGEIRVSNYYLWQMAYTELYFTDTLWPDFCEDDFDNALESYSKRNRRYGKRA